MVKGLERFREHFKGHEASYALIGGAACDILFGEAGLSFRATKDFDIVLCVEVVGAEVGTVFADFLEVGGYRARERSTGRREFYRFHRPADDTFPAMIELFARRPDTELLPEGGGACTDTCRRGRDQPLGDSPGRQLFRRASEHASRHRRHQPCRRKDPHPVQGARVS